MLITSRMGSRQTSSAPIPACGPRASNLHPGRKTRQCLSFLILRDWLEMEGDPRSHTKQLCSFDLVWFRGSFLFNPRKRTKRNSDTTKTTQFCDSIGLVL